MRNEKLITESLHTDTLIRYTLKLGSSAESVGGAVRLDRRKWPEERGIA